jgi:hypothetical protein
VARRSVAILWLQQLKVELLRDSCYLPANVKPGIDHPACPARRGAVHSARALALAATALLAGATSAGAAATEIGDAWFSGFQDSAWTSDSLGRPRSPPSPLSDWTARCLVNCGPAFGTSLVRRIELLSSNTADVSVNKAADPGGHRIGLSGMIVTERLARDGFGADWAVVAERALDSSGTHAWSVSPMDGSLDAHGVPIELYRFESASFSIGLAATAPAAGATPEPQTWAMMLIGFAALGVAAYRRSVTTRGPTHSPERMHAR